MSYSKDVMSCSVAVVGSVSLMLDVPCLKCRMWLHRLQHQYFQIGRAPSLPVSDVTPASLLNKRSPTLSCVSSSSTQRCWQAVKKLTWHDQTFIKCNCGLSLDFIKDGKPRCKTFLCKMCSSEKAATDLPTHIRRRDEVPLGERAHHMQLQA